MCVEATLPLSMSVCLAGERKLVRYGSILKKKTAVNFASLCISVCVIKIV